MKKIISIVLTLTILMTALLVPVGAAENTYVADYDRETPVVIVHGMSQNDTYVLDENGERMVDENGAYVTGWPLKLDIMALVKEAAIPLLLSAFLKRDMGLTDAMRKGAYNGLPYIHKDSQGVYEIPVEVPCYEMPMGELPEDIREAYYKLLPLQGLVDIVGGDNVYYFGYDSFGDIVAETDKLNYYIHNVVLPQTGAEQIKVCFISLGGAIGTYYLEKYPEDYQLFKKVEFVVPALDGSDIIGDILTGNLSVMYDDEVLYEQLLVTLLGDTYLSYIINMVLRILPSWLLKEALAALAEGVVEAGVPQRVLLKQVYAPPRFSGHFVLRIIMKRQEQSGLSLMNTLPSVRTLTAIWLPVQILRKISLHSRLRAVSSLISYATAAECSPSARIGT